MTKLHRNSFFFKEIREDLLILIFFISHLQCVGSGWRSSGSDPLEKAEPASDREENSHPTHEKNQIGIQILKNPDPDLSKTKTGSESDLIKFNLFLS